MGNTVQSTYSTSDITFPSNSDDTTFYDYVFTLQSVTNPSDGFKRTDTSRDYTYPDSTETDLSDNLWTRYEKYSKKFDIGVWDEAGTTNSDTNAYQARSYGVLSHAWLGFFKFNDILYILDNNYEVNDVECTEGLLSPKYYVATGNSKSNSNANPCVIESCKMSAGEWVQFEKDADGNAKNTIKEFGTQRNFRLAAGQTEGGTIKFISWGTLE